jgi:RNA polymerase sigma-70 factor (ECF subfamily)
MSRDELGALCERTLPAVYRRARMRLPAEAVDDVVQDTFLAATRSFHRWRRDSSFKTWVHGILRHKVVDYYRHKGHLPDTVGLEAAHAHPLTNDYRTRATVRIVLSDLSERDQEVLMLRFAEGMKFKNVAAELCISLEAAKSRYRRAVDHFAEVWCEA